MGVLQQSPARKSFLSPAPRLAKPNKYDGKPKTPSASTKQPQVRLPPQTSSPAGYENPGLGEGANNPVV